MSDRRRLVFFFKAWFPYRCICRVCRTKKIHRTDRIHSILYNKLYLSFLLYWAFVREVSIKLYLSYEFFSYDRHEIRRIQRYGNQALGRIRDAIEFSKTRMFFVIFHSSAGTLVWDVACILITFNFPVQKPWFLINLLEFVIRSEDLLSFRFLQDTFWGWPIAYASVRPWSHAIQVAVVNLF